VPEEDSGRFDPEQLVAEKLNYLVNEDSTARYVDLTCFPPGIDGYLASLSRNRRGQIRRSMKAYEQGGSLDINESENLEQALLYFDRLKVLHTEH
jgi:hypothetical protein